MARGSVKYPVPDFLSAQGITQERYGRWLDQITTSHVGRDRLRFREQIQPAVYRQAIHDAVIRCRGRDVYTGRPVNFRLLACLAGTSSEDRDERLVPALDHVRLSAAAPLFEICSARTNRCKMDLTEEEFREIATGIIAYFDKAGLNSFSSEVQRSGRADGGK
jgi:hypothetical protein